jgi:polyhydroxybutyrate depolymerase
LTRSIRATSLTQMHTNERHTPDGRRSARRVLAAVAAILALAVAAACAPLPSPGVQEPLPGRGIVDGVDVAPTLGCEPSDPLPAGHSTFAIDSPQGPRRVALDVPATAAAGTPAPLLVSLHPFLVDGAGWEQYSGLAQAAAARGYVVITPDGSQPGPRWSVPGGLDLGVDDLSHLTAVIDHVEDRTCVDRNREFAAGFSAGAAMSQALSCTFPWRFAAVAASGGANLTSTCADAAPTDVLVLHGTADPIAPVAGSQVPFAPPVGLHLDQVVAANRVRAGCSGEPVVELVTGDVRVERSAGCSGGRRVEWWQLLGAGHTWAGQPAPLLELVTGPTTTSISANEVVLDFFDSTAARD